MRSLPTDSLHRACTRSSPRRLSGADRPEVGAGHAAADTAFSFGVVALASASAWSVTRPVGTPSEALHAAVVEDPA